MMPIRELVKTANRNHATKFGVDEIKYEFEESLLHGEKEIKLRKSWSPFGTDVREQVFISPVVRWRISNHWFYGTVPLTLRKHIVKSFLSGEEFHKEDHGVMEKELTKMIEESRKKVAA